MNWMGGTRKKVIKSATNVHIQIKAGFERVRRQAYLTEDAVGRRIDQVTQHEANQSEELVRNSSHKHGGVSCRSTNDGHSIPSPRIGTKHSHAEQSLIEARLGRKNDCNPDMRRLKRKNFVDAGLQQWEQVSCAQPRSSSSQGSLKSARVDIKYKTESVQKMPIATIVSASQPLPYLVGRCPSSSQRSTAIENEWRRLAGAEFGLLGRVVNVADWKSKCRPRHALRDAQKCSPKRRSRSPKRCQRQSSGKNQIDPAPRPSVPSEASDFRTPSPSRNVWSSIEATIRVQNSTVNIAPKKHLSEFVEITELKQPGNASNPDSRRVGVAMPNSAEASSALDSTVGRTFPCESPQVAMAGAGCAGDNEKDAVSEPVMPLPTPLYKGYLRRTRGKVELGLRDAWKWSHDRCGGGGSLANQTSTPPPALLPTHSNQQATSVLPLSSAEEAAPTQPDDEVSQVATEIDSTPTEPDEDDPPLMQLGEEVSRETSPQEALQVLRAARGKVLRPSERRRLCGMFWHG